MVPGLKASGQGGAGVPAEGLGAWQCRLPQQPKQLSFMVKAVVSHRRLLSKGVTCSDLNV